MSLRSNLGGGNSQDNRGSVLLADDQIEELREKFVKVVYFCFFNVFGEQCF